MNLWSKSNLVVISVLAVFAAGHAHARPALTLPTLVNGSFETPSGAANRNNGTTGLAWTGSDGYVEIFENGSPLPSASITAYEGTQWAEVQAAANPSGIGDTISQAVTGFTGAFGYKFSFAHRGRAGTDTIQLDIIDTTGTPANLFTQQYSTDNSAWVLYQGVFYTAPATTSVDFKFTAISSAVPTQSGNGNFVDAVSFSEVPGPLPIMGAASAFACSRRIRRRIGKVHP